VSIQIGHHELPVNELDSPLIPKTNKAYHFVDPIDDIVQDINENRRIMLVGHCGIGKTSCIKELAARTNNGFISVHLNNQTTIGDFVGNWIVKNGDMKWIDGSLPLSVRNGYWLLVDEIDFAEANFISVLNPLLEKDGKLILKEKGYEVIEPHPNFRLFSAGNTMGCMQEYRSLYQGTNIMNEAFLDRWRIHHIKCLPGETETKVLMDYVPKLSLSVASQIVSVATLIRDAFEKEEVSNSFSTRRLIDWSEQMIRHRHPIKAGESTIFSKISKEDSEVIKGIISRVMLGEEEIEPDEE